MRRADPSAREPIVQWNNHEPAHHRRGKNTPTRASSAAHHSHSNWLAQRLFNVVDNGGDLEAVLRTLLALGSPHQSVLLAASQLSRSQARSGARPQTWITTAIKIELAVRTGLFC
jgi:hypothetical protein